MDRPCLKAGGVEAETSNLCLRNFQCLMVPRLCWHASPVTGMARQGISQALYPSRGRNRGQTMAKRSTGPWDFDPGKSFPFPMKDGEPRRAPVLGFRFNPCVTVLLLYPSGKLSDVGGIGTRDGTSALPGLQRWQSRRGGLRKRSQLEPCQLLLPPPLS
ncbi:hypothetical protein GWK47_024914 [Chionoecetes opilio]|uniref:Uncharacterized protein n=1 Tax=Chionoecetes opilio TaxID=41210 RepID=A0A8J4XN27_CHIOP|nr:hypothetical protein GWK47_024914 [Chionoecetes opilio]